MSDVITPVKPEEPPKRREKPDTDGVVCGYCGADPLIFWNSNMTDALGRVLVLVQCIDCRKLLGVSQIAQLNTGGGRIIKPS